jgi:uncharacterized repeat protein (TIGR01451 family)
MRNPIQPSLLYVAILLALTSGTLQASPAQPGDALGVETVVNAWVTGRQNTPRVATDASGNYAVAWRDQSGADGYGDGVFVRIFDNSGSPLSGDILVNTTTDGLETFKDIAMDANGRFVVLYGSAGAKAQRFAANGDKIGGEFEVPTIDSVESVAMDAAGNFVVTGYVRDCPTKACTTNIMAQRYDADANPVGDVLTANTTVSDNQSQSKIAMDAEGNFVVAWEYYTDADGYDILAQRFNAAGTPQGGEFLVNTTTAGYQDLGALAMDVSGNFIVAWTDDSGVDGDGIGILAQRFAADGSRAGGEFVVNTTTTGEQYGPAVAMDAEGNFTIAWADSTALDGSGQGVFGQRYDASGATQGGEFQVNTTTNLNQMEPAIAQDADGDTVVAWADYSGADSSEWGILAQRFAGNGKTVDLSLLASAHGDTIAAGKKLTYTFSVTNSGSGSAVAITLRDMLPLDVTYSSFSSSGWACSDSSGIVTCTLPSLASGADSSVDVVVSTTGLEVGAVLDNTASVTSAIIDANSSDNSDSVSTTITEATSTSSGGGAFGWLSLLLGGFGLYRRRR